MCNVNVFSLHTKHAWDSTSLPLVRKSYITVNIETAKESIKWYVHAESALIQILWMKQHGNNRHGNSHYCAHKKERKKETSKLQFSARAIPSYIASGLQTKQEYNQSLMKEHYLLVRVEKTLLTRQPNTLPAPSSPHAVSLQHGLRPWIQSLIKSQSKKHLWFSLKWAISGTYQLKL